MRCIYDRKRHHNVIKYAIACPFENALWLVFFFFILLIKMQLSNHIYDAYFTAAFPP